jgi:hypothetical protein
MNRRFQIFRFLLSATGRCVWNSLKQCVKVLLGRKPHFDERSLFLRQYVLHLTGLRPIRTITCVRRSGREGAGSQAHTVMNAINFARASGLTYVHTPFLTIHHADRPMPEWVHAWEVLFNLGAGEAVCDVQKHEVVNYCYSSADIEKCFGWRDRRKDLIRNFKTMIPEFRAKYYLNRRHRVTDEVTVAVHIRRGDVSAGNGRYFTSTEVVLQTVTAVKSILDNRKIKHRIGIYSQGDIVDFAALSGPGIEFFLDADPLWTMQELIEADVLVMARGFFSYCAALISDGIRIFEPRPVSLSREWFLPGWAWMHVPLGDDWLPCADGSIDKAAFDRQLSLLMQAKVIQT